ncbi:MAG: autotransporter domain-containing protein [Pseudomonadota bacterium]
MVHRPLSPTPSPIKQRLLTGASIAVITLASAAIVAPSGAWAQDTELVTGITGTPAFTGGTGDGTLAAGEAIVSDDDSNDQDFGVINTDTTAGVATLDSITLTDPDVLFVFDNDGDTNTDADTVTVSNNFVVDGSINSGGTDDAADITAQVTLGASNGSTPAEGATLLVQGNLAGSGGNTQGDSLTVDILAGGGASSNSGFTVEGNTNMTAITTTAGAAAGGAVGGNIASRFGDAQTDTVVVGTFGATGGAGETDAANAGGATTSVIEADTTITTLNVTGGVGGASGGTANGGAGGASQLTVTDTDGASLGAIAVTGGAGGEDVVGDGNDGGAGGTATLIIDTDSVANTATSIAIAGGEAGADNGTGTPGAGGAADLQLAGDITAAGGISLTDHGGSATFTLNGTSDQTVTGAITAGADGDGEILVNNTGGGGTTVNFASTVGTSDARIGTITLTNADVVEFDATVFAGTITTAATTAEVQFDADVDATGIDGTAGDTILDFNANLTIGAGDLRLGTGGGFFAGDLSGTGTLQVDTGDNAEFDGTAGQTISNAIVSAGTGTGNITVSNTADSGVTFNSTIGTAANRVGVVELEANANATFVGEVQATEIRMTDGSHITINNSAAAGTPMVVATGGLGFLVTEGTITLGSEVGNGDIVFQLATDAGVNIASFSGPTVVNLAANFTSGAITLVDDDDDLTGLGTQFAVTDHALATFTIDDTANDIVITAQARTTAETATQLGVSQEAANTLVSAVNAADAGGDDEALTAFSTALNAGGTTATNAAEQAGVQGDTQGGASNTAFNAVGQQQTITGNRLASSRSGSQYGTSGFSSGDYYAGPQGGSYWIQGFGGIAMADGDSNAAGYDAGFGGFAVGADGQFSEDVTVGVFGSYTHSYVEGEGAGQSEVSSNTYLIGAYGGFATQNFYLDAFAAYAYADNESSRIVNVGGLDRTYVGDYGSSQVTLAATAGTPFEVGHSVFITPNAGLTWNHYDAEDYTETGTGALTASVDSETVNQLTGTVGARIHAVFDGVDRSGTVFIPELRLGVAFDLIDDDAVSTATFTGGGAAYQTTGTDTDDIGALLGLGLGFDNPDWSANLTYDADLRSDFHSHTARAEVRVKF